MALKRATEAVPRVCPVEHTRVGGRGGCVEALLRNGVEQLLVQILVGVASIQARSLKTEVEQGSMRRVLRHG